MKQFAALMGRVLDGIGVVVSRIWDAWFGVSFGAPAPPEDGSGPPIAFGQTTMARS
jgi:hypothetical protein